MPCVRLNLNVMPQYNTKQIAGSHALKTKMALSSSALSISVGAGDGSLFQATGSGAI